MKPLDPLQLQRLIDGELDSTQTQRLLMDANDAPEQWREIATGFIENQSWSRAFQSEGTLNPAAHLGSETGRVGDKPVARPAVERAAINSSWLVMAASLLVAATIGYMFSLIQNRDLPGTAIVEAKTQQAGPLLADNSSDHASTEEGRREESETPRITQADYHLEVPATELGELASAGPVAPVPLYAISDPGQRRRLKELNQQNTPAISPELLKQLAGSGYQMKQNINYISGRLEDGRSFVVPVRTIQFASGQ